MARVTYGAAITELTGSIGGITFQRNSSGTIARFRPGKGVNPSPGQSTQQYRLGFFVYLWSTLSLAQKTTWDDLAAAHDNTNPWGVTKHLNGFQWFIHCNLNLIQIGESPLYEAPAFDTILAPGSFYLIADASDLKIHPTSSWSPDSDWICVYFSSPIKSSSLLLRKSTFYATKTHGFESANFYITAYWESLFNLDWTAFYNSAQCNLLVRARRIQHLTGLSSMYTSAIIKIG
jgi:hypothetical protein